MRRLERDWKGFDAAGANYSRVKRYEPAQKPFY
jgi:hypothetical protein